jgi:hypothetical protein
LPAALEHAGRAVAVPVAKAPSIAEAGASTVAEALAIADTLASAEAFIFDKGHANATSGLTAKAVAETEEFTATQTFSIGEA